MTARVESNPRALVAQLLPFVGVEPMVAELEHVEQLRERAERFAWSPESAPASTVVSQPAPRPSSGPAIWPLVVADMQARDELGRKRYGTPLRAHNGRDPLVDAYEEALDLAVYLRQAIVERGG